MLLPLYAINPDMRIETDAFELHFESSGYDRFVLRKEQGRVAILYPSGFRFEGMQTQLWLHKVLVEVFRSQARLVLLPRFREHVERTGLEPRRVFIKQTRSCWGSCSGKQNINLSLFLMLLPYKFIDYVMLHELCHLCEMNHSPRFWTLLDSFTEGNAKTLRRELREYARVHELVKLMR